MKILNVDDKLENQYLMEVLFRGNGHEIVSARDGCEALEAANREGFDAIVSDLLMPRMDGFQLVRELRRNPRLNHIPIIVYTATYTDSKDEELALRLGADRFLLKPAEGDDLLAAVREAVHARVSGFLPPPPPPPDSKEEVVELKQYNSRLIAKLENKMRDLERINQELQEGVQSRKRAEAERDRLEEQLRHAQKMEAIGTLAGGVAHDFNNILTGILCAAELGLAETRDTRRLFADIAAAGGRARELVKQILAFSRHQAVERKPLDLRIAVREAVRFLRSTLPAGIRLEINLARQVPLVQADLTQIHQIITNLCTNAWHAIGTRDNGRIELALQTVELGPEPSPQPKLEPGRYVCLSVADNGCGIDTAIQAHIFEPFFTTKPPGVGTGLGLSVVRGIMRSYNGAIAVASQPGQGSTFQLYFPALDGASVEPTRAATEIPRGRGQRILFIDDELMLVRLGEKILRHLGYTPLPFTDPLKAIEEFSANGADLLLVDFSMPGCDGLELARRVLAQRPEVPIVLMTGFGGSLDAEQVRARGLSGLLPKPYTQESIGRLLHQLLPREEKGG